IIRPNKTGTRIYLVPALTYFTLSNTKTRQKYFCQISSLNFSEVPEGAKQRSLRSDGVLEVRRTSKQAVTKHNGAYGKFI
ncbi:MAG: hypothetical protein IKL58_02260, partial [Phascolarctobacterium sp.]|nr:hypothetical protein [Phascolarctobacterium sp.]